MHHRLLAAAIIMATAVCAAAAPSSSFAASAHTNNLRDGIAAGQPGGTRIQATISIEGSTNFAGEYCSKHWWGGSPGRYFNTSSGGPQLWGLNGTSNANGTGVHLTQVYLTPYPCNPNEDDQGVFGL